MLFLMKHQKISKPLFQVGPNFQPTVGEFCDIEDSSGKYISGDRSVINGQEIKVAVSGN